jgi:hypothetical protein
MEAQGSDGNAIMGLAGKHIGFGGLIYLYFISP